MIVLEFLSLNGDVCLLGILPLVVVQEPERALLSHLLHVRGEPALADLGPLFSDHGPARARDSYGVHGDHTLFRERRVIILC